MPKFFPDRKTFDAHLASGKSQLVWTWIPADLETPVSAYLKIAGDAPKSFLLESVEGGATLGRYSSIGLEPDLVWQGTAAPSALNELRTHVRESKIDVVAPDMPPMSSSGLFGYMGYGMVRLVEDIPDTNPDTLGIPDSIFIRPTIMVTFDNVQSRLCIATPVRNSNDSYDAAIKRLEKIILKLNDPVPSLASPQKRGSIGPEQQAIDVISNHTKESFFKMVERAAEYIRSGDIFQVVLGQSFSAPFPLSGFALYRSLRRLNPSPFLFYFNFGGFQIVGSSPEILVRVRDRRVTIRPIAGTRKRGRTAEEDAGLAAELLADPKECAEHLMLLDLGRNDVGRVSKIGSVKVTEKFVIEKYSHVMHIVSNVEGVLRDDLDSFDALFAGFPAGTVSGAPKVRAMQIIDELETSRRCYYGGCIGYFDGGGNLDTCIALRTALVKDGKVHVQAGAGVVADSTPEFEYNETIMKARAILAAAEDALSS